MEEVMRLKSVQEQLLVENSNNKFLIKELSCEKSNITADSSIGDNNSNTTLHLSRSEEKWDRVSWEDNRQTDNFHVHSSPRKNLNSADYPECVESSSSSSSGGSSRSSSCGEESDCEEEELPRSGIVNPNYPGFQHLLDTLQGTDLEKIPLDNHPQETEENRFSCDDDNNNQFVDKVIGTVNKFDQDAVKEIYSRPKLDISLEKEVKLLNGDMEKVSRLEAMRESARDLKEPAEAKRLAEDINRMEKGERESAPRKKEKTEINMNMKKMAAGNLSHRPNRFSQHKGSLDVYKIETAMPHIDLEAIETHLRAARDEERRRRNDREEIRRRLATGDPDDYPGSDRPGKKPSLQSRLQSGMNLQICFMNDAMSDTESPGSDGSPMSMPPPTKPKPVAQEPQPHSLVITSQSGEVRRGRGDGMELDFFSRQARLQAEARMALAQAKDLARVQMQQERRRYQTSPITDMLRTSLKKVGVSLAEGRRRVSRQLLTDMNVAQLQVIVNDLHSQIEVLNEGLVKYLMERDELHMGQDSMLVDIEDLTRYLGAKESLIKEEMAQSNINHNNNNISPMSKPVVTRIVSLGKK